MITLERILKVFNQNNTIISKYNTKLDPNLISQVDDLTNEQLSQLVEIIIEKIRQTAEKGGANKIIGERQWTEVIQTFIEYGNMQILRSFKFHLQMD